MVSYGMTSKWHIWFQLVNFFSLHLRNLKILLWQKKTVEKSLSAGNILNVSNSVCVVLRTEINARKFDR